ncbi:MAG: SDR family oxidoreductase [Planctomycetota bacterium]
MTAWFHRSIKGAVMLATSCPNQLGVPGYAAYSASKAGLRSLARTLSAELMSKDIRVNSIARGPFEMPIHSKYGISGGELDAVKQQIASMVPHKRFGTTDETVDAVVFLASESSRYMRGEEISIDGGWTNL